MGLHLYCLVPEAGLPPESPEGIDGAVTEEVRLAGLSLWCSAHRSRPRPELARIRAHDRVVRMAFSGESTPLPFRFGQWVSEPEELESFMRERAEEYRRLLDRVAGAVEFAIRLERVVPGASGTAEAPQSGNSDEPPGYVPEPEVDRSRGTGARYLRTLARRRAARERGRREGEEALADLHDRLGDRVRHVHIDPKPANGSLISAAHLVDRGGASEYRIATEEWADRQTMIVLRTTGPWPPYSFTEPEEHNV